MKVNQFDPYVTQDEINSIVETLKNNWITEGPKTAEFQKQSRELTGAKHVILLPNGTLALYVALKISDIGPGDEVIVPAFIFIASASSICLTDRKFKPQSTKTEYTLNPPSSTTTLC